jgi:DNA-binding transcriptional LysR family regulator
MPIHKETLSLSGLPSVRQLRAFVAVYYTGQVSAAAEQLALTQPAVTVLLRELEARLGVRLFDRSTRSLRRTHAATEAVAYAERALSELEALGASMAQLAAGERGLVRIAATSTIAQTVLPPVMRRHLDLHPGVKVLIDDCAPAEFLDRVTSDRVDFGVGTLEAPVSGVVETVFLRDWLMAAALPGPGFVAGQPMTWKQLERHPIVTVKAGYGVRRRLERAADEAGVQLRIAHEVSLLTTAAAMAASGLGVAVVPGSILAQGNYPQLAGRRLVRPSVERSTAVVRRADRTLSPAAEGFIRLLSGRGNGAG